MSKRVIAQCAVCGKAFERFVSQATGKELFCSRACTLIRNGGKIPITCQECGKVVYLKKTLAGRAKYCSRTCKYKAHAKILIGRQHKEPVPVTCVTCGKIRLFPPSVAPARRHCSRACHAEEQRQQIGGENNFNWRGGYEPYYGPNWHEQRQKARKRDNYICQVCGVTEAELGCELDVHHIQRHGSFNKDYERANQLGNLVSLCRPCHKRVEHNSGLL